MVDHDGLEEGGLLDVTRRSPGWTGKDLCRALAPEEPAARPDEARLSRREREGESLGFTLRDAHRFEWVLVASMPRPGFTIVVYRAGPGFVVRRQYPGSDLLHLRVCANRVEVCRYLLEKLQVPFFAKMLWGFLAKAA